MGNCEFTKNEQEVSTSINHNHFQQHYVIGRGGYGKVWKVKYKKENKDYAMKVMSKAVILAKKSVTSINFERELLSRINHPFICNICYAFQDSENLFLVLELSNGGDLRYHLFKNIKFQEKQAKFIGANIVLGLQYLHEKAIIHRDLKPENILFDKNGYMKLTDFGIARTWSPNNANDTSGTPGYMAPEVVHSRQHGLSVDFWALGVILYELMFGKRPYAGTKRKEYKENISSSFVQIKPGEQPNEWSNDSVDLINGLLQRKDELRLGSKGIEKIKEHAWFGDIDWEQLLEQKLKPPFIPPSIEDYFDENYLQSFEINPKLKEDIQMHMKTLRNPNIQKFFKDFYYDKDKGKLSQVKAPPTSASKTTV